MEVAPELHKLYGHLVDRGCIVQLSDYEPSCLKIFSGDVLDLIKAGDPSWEAMVPSEIAEIIKRRGFFGFKKKGGDQPAGPSTDRRYDN